MDNAISPHGHPERRKQKQYSLSLTGPHGLRVSANGMVREAAGEGGLGREQICLLAV